MNTKVVLKGNEILEKYKISKDHLVWICKMYHFPDGSIPVEFLDSLVLCTISSTNPSNTTQHQYYNFFDYKLHSVSIPLSTSVWIPEPNLNLIEQQKLQLSDKKMHVSELLSNDSDGEFVTSERNVLAYMVSKLAFMKLLIRTEAEVKDYRVAVNKAIATRAAEEHESK